MHRNDRNNDNNKEEKRLVNKESIYSTCAIFSFLTLLILFSRSLIFGMVGLTIHNFLTGVFGYFAYPIALGAFYVFVTSLFGKRFVKNRRLFFCITVTIVFLALILQTALTWDWVVKTYVKDCFYAAENFPKATVVGCLGGDFHIFICPFNHKDWCDYLFFVIRFIFWIFKLSCLKIADGFAKE